MIHHISFPANDPRHVADVIAELMGGKSYSFPGIKGSVIAVSGDPHGTAIEVHAADVLIEPSGPRHASNNMAPQRGPSICFSQFRCRASRLKQSVSVKDGQLDFAGAHRSRC